MTASSSSDSWYQDAAAAQIKTERLHQAERWNGRVAMIGFVLGVLPEAISGPGIVSQITLGFLGGN